MKLDLTGGGSAVLENNPLHMNKDVFAFLELISKFNYETARVTRKKLAVDQGRILKRIAHVRREADALSFKLSRLKDVDGMTEYEIGCALHESRKWDLDVQGLMPLMLTQLELILIGMLWKSCVEKSSWCAGML